MRGGIQTGETQVGQEGQGPGRWEYQGFVGKSKIRRRVWVPDVVQGDQGPAPDPVAEARRRILASDTLGTDAVFARVRAGAMQDFRGVQPSMAGLPELRRRLAGGR